MTKLVHATVCALTAKFTRPLNTSGPSLCLPVPPYSTLLGFTGNCIGRDVYPNEVRIGFDYSYGDGADFTSLDMETTHRFAFKNNKLKPHSDGNTIRMHEFHTYPVLELYLNNLDFADYLDRPRGIPTLGRSQDIAWIKKVEIVDAHEVTSGVVGNTLIPLEKSEDQKNVSGRLIRLPEFFDNSNLGMTRVPMNSRLFVITRPYTVVENPNLYSIESTNGEKRVIYLHEWSSPFNT